MSRASPAPQLLRLLGLNCAAGIVIGALAVLGLLALNPLLRNLILEDHSPAIALALLAGGFVVTFASAVMGSAVMRLGQD